MKTVTSFQNSNTTKSKDGILSSAKKEEFSGVYSKTTKNGHAYIIRYIASGRTTTKIIGYQEEGMTAYKAFMIKIDLQSTAKKRNVEKENIRYKYLFSTLWKEFLQFKSPVLARKTIKNYNTSFNSHYQSAFGSMDIRDITYKQLQDFINYKLKVYRPATVDKLKDGLKSFFLWLQDNGIVTLNPSRQIQMPKYDNKKYFAISQEKTTRVYDYLFFRMRPNFYATIFKFLLHGRRINEVLTLRWEDVDMDNKFYRIRFENSKVDKGLVFPLEDFLIEGLEKLDKTTQFVFESPKTKRPISYTSVLKRMKKLRSACDIQHMTIHSFRHMIGFLAINNGMSQESIAEILGHTSLSATKRYANVKLDFKRAAFSQVFGIIRQRESKT